MSPRPPISSIIPALLCFLLSTGMAVAQDSFELVGQNGCRGLMPENTFPGFIHAIELGVTTLQMDVVMSKDSQIVISHEPWISSGFCTHPNGEPVTTKEEKALNLYQMDYSEIQHYDCGKRFNPEFPEQQKITANKPTLKMVVRMIRGFAEDNKYPEPKFIIDFRSDPKWYSVYQPEPKKFVQQVTDVVQRLGISEITTFQSTDLNILEELNKIENHTYSIGYIVSKGKKLEKNLSRLSFTPDIYSPHYDLVTKDLISKCHEAGILIMPWMINDKAKMENIKQMGCDGGVTDYPDRVN
jgi:glycerophosphoryl diester phosphodiesterase